MTVGDEALSFFQEKGTRKRKISPSDNLVTGETEQRESEKRDVFRGARNNNKDSCSQKKTAIRSREGGGFEDVSCERRYL